MPGGSVEQMLDLDSAMNENTPALTRDGLTLLFSTDRAGGQGGEDIWTATRPELDAPFGAPVPVPPLSSAQTDRGPNLFDHDLGIVFFSTRAGGPGTTDIYIARRSAVD